MASTLDSPFRQIPRFEGRVLAASSVGSQAAIMPRVRAERPTFTPDTSRVCDVREAVGGEGSITFKDCNGAETAKIEWRRGAIVTDGDQEHESGCSGGSSGSFFS